MPSPTHLPQPHLWTRDGHLTALALDQRLCADLSDVERAAADDHISACLTCRDAFASIQRFHDEKPLPPLPWRLSSPSAPQNDDADDAADSASSAPSSPRTRAGLAWGGVGGLLAAAAAISLVVWLNAPTDPNDAPQLSGGYAVPAYATYSAPQDDIRIKGAAFSVEVFADAAPQGARRVHDGDAVSPGDRLGFKALARKRGYVMILGVDDSGQDYLCYPQHPSAHPSAQAAHLEATPQPVALDAAVRLDAALGQERLIGLLCDAPFSVSDVRAALAALPTPRSPLPATLRAGCAQWEMTLTKRSGVAISP